jgi:hypothetical protein
MRKNKTLLGLCAREEVGSNVRRERSVQDAPKYLNRLQEF